jgi:hypothetical protein
MSVKKICAPDLVDEICRLAGITKRDNPGYRVLSNNEIKQVLLRLQIVNAGSPLSSYSNEDLVKELAARSYFEEK